jgi:hypothetical protein
MFSIVPLQVLSGCLASLDVSTARILQPLETPLEHPLAPVPLFTWLPGIGKRLDHSWIDITTVLAKAAKMTLLGLPLSHVFLVIATFLLTLGVKNDNSVDSKTP